MTGGSCADGMSGRRRNAASGLRQVENHTGGVPLRVRRDSPPMQRQTSPPTLISAGRTMQPSERGSERRAPEVWFSPRPAEAPQARRAVSAADPLTTDLRFPASCFQFPIGNRIARMENVADLIQSAADWLFVPVLVIVLFGTALLMSVRLGFVQIRRFPEAVREFFGGRGRDAEGALSPFQ